MLIYFVDDPESRTFLGQFVESVNKAAGGLDIEVEVQPLGYVNREMAAMVAKLPNGERHVPGVVVVESVEACRQSGCCGHCGRDGKPQPDRGRYVILHQTMQMVAAHAVNRLLSDAAA